MSHVTPDAAAVAPIQLDVLIVGAGLSGIGAAHFLRAQCPDRSFALLEARAAIGGTWDLFRYPGIRSDSDMTTLGYSFRPWKDDKIIAEGGVIRQYIQDTAEEEGIVDHIHFNRKVQGASWSSADARWTVTTVDPASGQMQRYCSQFLLMCSGYYSYDEGYTPEFPGIAAFQGKVVHPQFWPEDLDYAGKKVIVIGSGATAMTLVPAMSRTAQHVVMLQRSPTYLLSRPGTDPMGPRLRRILPGAVVARFLRLKNILMSMYFFKLSRKRPREVKRYLIDQVKTQLGQDYDVATHFTPRYNPWDQRLCVVPDNDLFGEIKAGRASMATGVIESFTATGVKLTDGSTLDTDIVVTATGLKLNLLGDVQFDMDGVPFDMSKTMWYKGVMLSDVPNLAAVFGYTNASWTLKADLISGYFCRLLNFMSKHQYSTVVAPRDPLMGEEAALPLSSGYVQRASALLPKQGAEAPWKLRQSYPFDLATLKLGRIDDGALSFSRSRKTSMKS
jgi:cation diffusion facilitator CzcD-associated flavoprotein CzcO